MTLTSRQRGWILLASVAVVSIGLDQATKAWAEGSLKGEGRCEVSPHPGSPRGCLTVIEGYFNFQYARNPGAAFSFMATQGKTFRLVFFFVVTVVAVGAMTFLYHKMGERRPLYEWALGFLIGGAAGNLIDRLRLGGEVIDFAQMFVGKSAWPTYNVADAAIVAGIGLVLIDAFRQRREPTPAAGKKGK